MSGARAAAYMFDGRSRLATAARLFWDQGRVFWVVGGAAHSHPEAVRRVCLSMACLCFSTIAASLVLGCDESDHWRVRPGGTDGHVEVSSEADASEELSVEAGLPDSDWHGSLTVQTSAGADTVSEYFLSIRAN